MRNRIHSGPMRNQCYGRCATDVISKASCTACAIISVHPTMEHLISALMFIAGCLAIRRFWRWHPPAALQQTPTSSLYTHGASVWPTMSPNTVAMLAAEATARDAAEKAEAHAQPVTPADDNSAERGLVEVTASNTIRALMERLRATGSTLLDYTQLNNAINDLPAHPRVVEEARAEREAWMDRGLAMAALTSTAKWQMAHPPSSPFVGPC